MPTPLIEREITAHVSLTTPTGMLNREALGWSRTPVHDTSGIPGRGHWGRNKRWEYWNVMTPSHIVAVTVSCVDYMALHELWVLDRATGDDIDTTVISPGGRSATLPSSLGAGPARARTRRITVDIDETFDGTRLRASTPASRSTCWLVAWRHTSRSVSSCRGASATRSPISSTRSKMWHARPPEQ